MYKAPLKWETQIVQIFSNKKNKKNLAAQIMDKFSLFLNI